MTQGCVGTLLLCLLTVFPGGICMFKKLHFWAAFYFSSDLKFPESMQLSSGKNILSPVFQVSRDMHEGLSYSGFDFKGKE